MSTENKNNAKSKTADQGSTAKQQSLSSLIWAVADLIRGPYKPHEYGGFILPFTVLRRLDCVLAPTKAAALATYAEKVKDGYEPDPFVRRVTGLDFFNTSSLDMATLLGDQESLDYQMAVLTLKQYTDAASLINGLKQSYGDKEYVNPANRVANQFDVVGDTSPSAVSNSQADSDRSGKEIATKSIAACARRPSKKGRFDAQSRVCGVFRPMRAQKAPRSPAV